MKEKGLELVSLLFLHLLLKDLKLSIKIIGLIGVRCQTILPHLRYKPYNNNKGIQEQPISLILVQHNLFKKKRAITPTLNEFEGSQTYR
jgi:hypothetical protein